MGFVLSLFGSEKCEDDPTRRCEGTGRRRDDRGQQLVLAVEWLIRRRIVALHIFQCLFHQAVP